MSAPLFFDRPAFWPEQLGLPASLAPWASRVSFEPFFFLLIPLVLIAWAYGRGAALRGSTWAGFLHLAMGCWALKQDVLSRSFFVGVGSRIALLYAVPLIVSILARRERRQHAELQAAHHRLHRHAATVEQLATSRERNRLARELHDTLSHSLAALIVQLEALRSLLAHDPQAARQALDDITDLARQGLEESRQAIQALRADPLKTLGLVGALRGAVQAFQARTGVQATLNVAGREPDLTDEEDQILFRVAEEALSNVERHAAASQVSVRLAFGNDRVDLAVQDDGKGFATAAVEPSHFGLTGMQERCQMIGATLHVQSRPGGGTEVWCSLAR
jgi:signal transduction histidine kinase